MNVGHYERGHSVNSDPVPLRRALRRPKQADNAMLGGYIGDHCALPQSREREREYGAPQIRHRQRLGTKMDLRTGMNGGNKKADKISWRYPLWSTLVHTACPNFARTDSGIGAGSGLEVTEQRNKSRTDVAFILFRVTRRVWEIAGRVGRLGLTWAGRGPRPCGLPSRTGSE